MRGVPDVPDYPSCDYCGEEFAGKLFCSQCSCAFYCSKGCQQKHWKAPNGHKANCAKMEEMCQTKAESFIDALDKFAADTLFDGRNALRSFRELTEDLGENGPYMKALDLGLNRYLLQLFMFEASDFKQRFQHSLIVECVHFSLFRGKRNVPCNMCCIDGYRVKHYVRSNEEAFEKWFAASLKVIEMFQSEGLLLAQSNSLGSLDSFWQIQDVANTAACSWTFVFTNKNAAKAILLGSSKKVDDAAQERAMWIVTKMSFIINNFPSITLPDKQGVEGQTNIFTAMIQLRIEEFGIDIGDFLQLLGVKGKKKILYEYFAIPMAERSIEKGGPLEPNESRPIMQHYCAICKSHNYETEITGKYI